MLAIVARRYPNEALTGTEAAALHGHIVTQNRSINGSGNLGGTACLGAIAHDAANVTERVRDRRTNLLVRATAQPGNRSTGHRMRRK